MERTRDMLKNQAFISADVRSSKLQKYIIPFVKITNSIQMTRMFFYCLFYF